MSIDKQQELPGIDKLRLKLYLIKNLTKINIKII